VYKKKGGDGNTSSKNGTGGFRLREKIGGSTEEPRISAASGPPRKQNWGGKGKDSGRISLRKDERGTGDQTFLEGGCRNKEAKNLYTGTLRHAVLAKRQGEEKVQSRNRHREEYVKGTNRKGARKIPTYEPESRKKKKPHYLKE